MGSRTLWDPTRGLGCFYESTGGMAFGPTFHEEEALEACHEWLCDNHGSPARVWANDGLEKLAELVTQWRSIYRPDGDEEPGPAKLDEDAIEFERDPFVRVISMSAERARIFFGAPEGTRVEDGGPLPDRESHRHKPGARVWHIYSPERPENIRR